MVNFLVLVLYVFVSIFFSMMLLILFFMVCKFDAWDFNFSSGFECGFTSYFFSRFSFSIHYFLISLIFLFLDLELSFIFIFFLCFNSIFILFLSVFFFIFILLMGLFLEWWELKLEWIY